MRRLALSLVLVANPALADDVSLTSQVSAVTVYPGAAIVTREAAFDIAAGRHRLILADLPQDTPLASVRASVEGARMGGVSTRSDFVPPREVEDGAALTAARAEVARLVTALREGEAEVAAIRSGAEAARARLAFLDRIGQNERLAGLGPEKLRALGAMIGEETLSARHAAQQAEARAENADRALADTREALKSARARLAALVPEDKARAMAAVTVIADRATQGRIRLSYVTNDAGWQPAVDYRLNRAAARVTAVRGALVRQNTGENWQGVRLSLSTGRPSARIAPGEVHPWLPRIVDPDQGTPRPVVRSMQDATALHENAPADVSPVTAIPHMQGLQIRHEYPDPVDVATGADRVRLALGPLTLDADPMAEAVPLRNDRAYLVARVTNDSRQPLMPAAEARFYLDGRYVGQRPTPLIPAGAEARLPFGPIDGVRLLRQVVRRSEGDRGLVTRSNERAEDWRLTVENLTGEPWKVRLIDRVPQAEQDDLRIDWSARPAPDERDVDGRRGVLAWSLQVPPGATQDVVLRYRMTWPEGMVLR